MPNNQVKLDLSTLPKQHRDYIERCIQDSECLRCNIDNEQLPHWRMFYQISQALVSYMNSDMYMQSCSQQEDFIDFQILIKRLGSMVEHVEAVDENC